MKKIIDTQGAKKKMNLSPVNANKKLAIANNEYFIMVSLLFFISLVYQEVLNSQKGTKKYLNK